MLYTRREVQWKRRHSGVHTWLIPRTGTSRKLNAVDMEKPNAPGDETAWHRDFVGSYK